MKLAVALGGFAGFSIVTAVGFMGGRDPANILLEASIACVLIALLFRWLHLSFIRHVQSSLAARRSEARAVADEPGRVEKASTVKS